MAQLHLVVFLVTTAYHSAFTLAQDSCDQECILVRLVDLELKQRANDAENRELRDIISQQQYTIVVQDRRIDALEETLDALQQEAPQRQEFVAKQLIKDDEHEREDTDAVETTIAHENRKRSWPRRNVNSYKDNANGFKPKRQERSGIAFSIYLDHDVEVSDKQTIKFNKIITNEGNSYNNYTGVFTCPEAGMYILTYFIGERGGSSEWAKLIINSVNYVAAAVDTVHALQDLQGGNAIIVRLKAGDAVWLESGSNVGHVEGSGWASLSTFSGVLLYT